MTTRAETSMAAAPWLRDVAPDQLQWLASRGAVRNYRRRTYLFHQGDLPSAVYLLLQGRVELTSTTSSHQARLHSIVEPGHFFGEFDVIRGDVASTSALAVEESSAWVIGAAAFIEFVEESPRVARALLSEAARHMRALDEAIHDFVALDLRGRLAKWLLTLAASGRAVAARPEASLMQVESGSVTRAITHDDLAELCGASRENVARAMSVLQKRGIIEREGRQYYLNDVGYLRRLAKMDTSR